MGALQPHLGVLYELLGGLRLQQVHFDRLVLAGALKEAPVGQRQLPRPDLLRAGTEGVGAPARAAGRLPRL